MSEIERLGWVIICRSAETYMMPGGKELVRGCNWATAHNITASRNEGQWICQRCKKRQRAKLVKGHPAILGDSHDAIWKAKEAAMHFNMKDAPNGEGLL